MIETRTEALYLEDLTLGLSAEAVRTISEQDVQAFADVSGDHNPVHFDDDYARTTIMKGRVAHGMLAASFISAVMGAKLPGPGAVYLSQTLRFRRPVRIGDEVAVRVVVERIEGADVALSTICKVRGKVVVDGEAVVRVRRRSTGEAV